jgi:hypothetical protein
VYDKPYYPLRKSGLLLEGQNVGTQAIQHAIAATQQAIAATRMIWHCKISSYEVWLKAFYLYSVACIVILPILLLLRLLHDCHATVISATARGALYTLLHSLLQLHTTLNSLLNATRYV